MKILGIETSCDETGIAIFDGERGLLADHVYSQVKSHAAFGGVVPELASRDHVRKITPLVSETLEKAGISANQLDGVAYTAGPGLAGALLVGTSFAQGYAWALGIPALPVHHMEAHLLAPMLEGDDLAPPFLALLVSGGHTQLVDVKDLGRYQILGESLDDAAGEAFDKVAKMLDLGYPGGPAVERLAADGKSTELRFPRPMTDRPGLDFSFSGLKTAVLNATSDPEVSHRSADVALAFTEAVVDTFVIKCRRALEFTRHDTLVVAGGVSANKHLRNALHQMGHELGVSVRFPALKFATDNGAMIAFAGHERMSRGETRGSFSGVRPRWPIDELLPPANAGAE